MSYKIVIKCVAKNHWQVWWNDNLAFESKAWNYAESQARCFADGLEQGITGNKEKLYGNSRIITVERTDYLDEFDTYEDFKL